MISVGIIEENSYSRQELKDFLNLQDEFVCYVAAPSIKQFLMALHNGLSVLVILLSPREYSNEPSVFKQVQFLKRAIPEADIVVLSDKSDTDSILDCLRAGALGFLHKHTSVNNIKKVIMGIAAGGAYMSPLIARKIAEFFRNTPPDIETYNLTSREKEIVFFLKKGLSYKMIASELFLSLDTVRFHLRNVYKKLKVNSKAEVLAKVLTKELA